MFVSMGAECKQMMETEEESGCLPGIQGLQVPGLEGCDPESLTCELSEQGLILLSLGDGLWQQNCFSLKGMASPAMVRIFSIIENS